LPLICRVTFDTMLQKQNRLQVPKLVRRQYKVEASEVLRATVYVVGLFGNRERFLASAFSVYFSYLVRFLLSQSLSNSNYLNASCHRRINGDFQG